MLGACALLGAVALFVLATVLGWTEPGDLPRVGTWISDNRLVLLAGALIVFVVAWFGQAEAKRRIEKAEAAQAVRAVAAHERRELIDYIRDRYRELQDDRLQYRVSERLTASGQSERVEVHLPLGIEARPDQVLRPQLRRRTPKAPVATPPTTSLTQLHDEAGGRLLILGDPGSGKTTFLYGLALDLLDSACEAADPKVPVVVNLAAWGDDRRPIDEWLESRLKDVLGINDAVLVRSLVRGHYLHLLLDGLDEVEEGYRDACIEAVNTYLGERPERLTVCCRTQEYAAVQQDLHLNEAVEILPIEVDTVIRQLEAFPAAHEVRAALQTDAALRDLTTTPLVLSVVLLTYLGTTVRSFGRLAPELQMKALWDDYLVEMLRRKPDPSGAPTSRFTSADTLQWLAWLARTMKAADQTDFLLDRMQPDVYTNEGVYLWAVRIVVSLIVGLVFGLVFGLFSGLFGGLIFGLISGLVFGLVGGEIDLAEDMTWSWQAAIEGTKDHWKARLYFGLIGGLVVGLVGGLVGGVVFGLVVGLVFGLVLGLVLGIVEDGYVISSLPGAAYPGYRVRQTLFNGLVFGLVGGLVSGLVLVLVLRLVAGLVLGLVVVLVLGLVDKGGGGLRHYILRALLVQQGVLPWRTEAFLVFAADLVLLERDRDLVRFRHLLLRDHLAHEEMTPAHLAWLAARAEGSEPEYMTY